MISLIINTDYSHTTIALFKENKTIAQFSEENKNTSKFLLAHIDALCAQFAITMSDINFIGINQGPAPFTTLRVTLASVNGIAFASDIPLVGVDGIQALIEENSSKEWPYTVALLNAFNNDVYYAIQIPHREIKIGYKKIDMLLGELRDEYHEVPLRLIGSGVLTFKKEILKTLGDQAVIPDSLPLGPTLEQIATMALHQYEHNQTSSKLLPLYLKVMNYKKAILPT